MRLEGPLLAVTLLASFPRPAIADDTADRASEHFQRGVRLTDEGDIEGAIAEFEAANRFRAHPIVLFNLAQAYSVTGRPVDARRALRHYFEMSATDDPKRREQAAALERFNRTRVGWLELRVHPEGADVEIDGQPVGKAPFGEPLELRAGRHSVMATHSEHRPAVERILVERDTRAVVNIRLQPATEVPALATSTRRPPESGEKQRIWALVGAGTGATMLGAATLIYVLNSPRYDAWEKDRDELEFQLEAQGGTPQLLARNADLTSKALRIQRTDDIALGLGLLGGVLVATGSVLWFTAPQQAEPDRVAVGIGPQRVELKFAF